MKDSVSWQSIPIGTPIVAGYVPPSRFAWPLQAWQRFAGSVEVHITPSVAAFGRGIHVLDVESGDATPSQVPGWCNQSRNAGQEPTVYCNASAWTAVIQSCLAAGVPVPQFWIAEWNGVQTLPTNTVNGVVYTAVAKQYADPNSGSGGNWDSSIVADFWPGVDGPSTSQGFLMALTDAQQQQLYDAYFNTANAPYGITIPDLLQVIRGFFLASAQDPNGQTVYDAIWEARDAAKAVPAAVWNQSVSDGTNTNPAGAWLVSKDPNATVTIDQATLVAALQAAGVPTAQTVADAVFAEFKTAVSKAVA